MTDSNMPPADADPLRERLTEQYADMLKRADELIAAAARVPACDSDEIAGKIGDFTKQVTAHVKLIEGTRVQEKEPYLASGRTVDGFFGTLKDRLDKSLKPVRDKLSAYLRAKEEQARREAQEAARRQREEADRLAREALEAEAARNVTSSTLMDQAAAVETQAAQAEAKIEAAKPADFARTRGDLGSVSTLVRRWTWRDLDRATLDLEALRYHLPADALEKAVRSAIKAGTRELRGVFIFEEETASVR